MKETYILNVCGGHGHFLQWILDKLCLDTPPIESLPYNHLGASHKDYKKSGKFIFVDDPKVEGFLKTHNDKNAVLITIDDEVLYWERSYLYRSGDAGTNLFDENSIIEYHNNEDSSFPKFCQDNNLTIKQGYTHAFKDINNCGARMHDNERKNFEGITNNNIFMLPIKSFFSEEHLKYSLLEISKKFSLRLDLSNFSETYDTFYKANIILQTHNHVEQYLKGDNSIKLDVLQQAYVDAQQNQC
jgi:hypothetical protein